MLNELEAKLEILNKHLLQTNEKMDRIAQYQKSLRSKIKGLQKRIKNIKEKQPIGE